MGRRRRSGLVPAARALVPAAALAVELARRALGRLEWGRYEPAPGCAARRVVVIPFHLRAERR
jgi:hypothetical protein